VTLKTPSKFKIFCGVGFSQSHFQQQCSYQAFKHYAQAEAVLPLGGLGGRLGRQISGGGKFFEKKIKIGVFSGTARKQTDCRPIELRLQFAAPMLPLPLIPILPPPSTPAPPHHNLPPTNMPDRIRLRWVVGGGAAVCVIA
jgi:hypothetical protein